jgi:hypothetical protein
MKARAAAIVLLLVATPALGAFDKRVEVDANTDFSAFKTFAVRAGVAKSRNPEIDNVLTVRTVENAVRGVLVARGLKETTDSPDLIATFDVTEGGQRGAPPPGQRGTVRLSASTLIVDLTRRDTNRLVWHGIYSDIASSPATIASRLPGHARKLLEDFPPKKKR